MTLAYQLRDVQARYGGRLALDLPDLDLRAGEACALLGGNGAGKSTLLQLLALLRAPDRGSIHLLDQPARTSDLDLRRQVTLVHQNPVLFSTTVHRNVAFGLRARSLPRADESARVTAALAQVGLDGFAARPAHQLSGGEAQRVILARALVMRTPILLLDEPTSYLDAEVRPLLVDLLRERTAAGATVIVATHAEGFASEIAQRQVQLVGGREA
jgi:tungstate transport system ATP-binding protein